MFRPTSLLVVALAGLTLAAGAQQRVKAKGPADFGTSLGAAEAAWKKESYGACIAALKDALGVATLKRIGAIRAALPSPDGWRSIEDRSAEEARANPMAAAMMAGVGTQLGHEYRREDGGSLKVSLTLDSPLVQMFNMWVANPAMLEKGAELIKYGDHNAVLKTGDNRLELQILIDGAHLCEVRARGGVDEDALFAVFDQAAVDRLAAALRR
jgi:hypothetical protein